VRTQQTREPRRYLRADPRSLSKADCHPGLPFEFAMNGFRLVDGFAMTCSRPDRAAESRSREALRPWWPAGWWNGRKRWRATPKGFRFLNEILVELLPRPASDHP
jgi:hypothetical protein